MNKESFEFLNEYKEESLNYLVTESLFEAEDDDGVFGKIIARGLTFVPRAMRFNKAKKIMKKALIRFTKKAKNLVKKFGNGFKSKIDVIDKEYQKMMKDKIQPLLKENKVQEAVDIMESQKKELDDYKKEQMNILEKGIDNILTSYTTSIENRIQNPGFVLNVELSEKGKGELRAKWQELAALQKIEVDKEKTNLISSPGWRKLEDISAEMSGFIRNKKIVNADIDIFIQDIEPQEDGNYLIKVHVRITRGRPTLKEKGLIIGKDANNLDYGAGVRTIKVTGQYQYNTRPYSLVIAGNPQDYVRPYLIFKDMKIPVYGDIASLDVRAKSKEEKKMGLERIIGKSERSLEDEKDIINKKNK